MTDCMKEELGMWYKKMMLTKNQVEGGIYQTNGILALDGDVCVDAILDVSQHESMVGKLVGMLNHREVSLLHFREVVEDYINV